MKKFQNFLALLLAATFVLSAGMFTDAAYAKQVATQAPSISENHELEEEPAPTSSPSDEASPSPNASPADASPSVEANSSEAQTGDGNASESDGANARSGQVHQWSASELNALRSSAEHSGKYGDVGWWIKNGVLHLGTADWQTLGDYDSRRNELSYWNDYRDIISAVSIDYRIKGSKNMSYLFFGLGKLESITVNQATAPYGWRWDGVESLENICNNDVSLTDISAFSHIEYDSHNPQRPKSFKYAFKHCEKLQDLTPLKDWMFENMWDTGVEGMFSDCYSLKDLTPISYREVNGRRYWNMDFAQTFLDMFKNCRSLEKLDGLGDWNVGNVTNMQNMFQGCSNLTDLSAISNWQVGNVQQMVSMFEACTSLIDLAPLNGWKPDAALTMASLFSGDGRIHDVSALKDWPVGRVTDTSNMFANVNTISPVAQMSFAPLANWHFGYNALTQYTGMFSGVKNIYELGVPPVNNGGKELAAAYAAAFDTPEWRNDIQWIKQGGPGGEFTGPFSVSKLASLMQSNQDKFGGAAVYMRYGAKTGSLAVTITLENKNFPGDKVPRGGKTEFQVRIRLFDDNGKPITGSFTGGVVSNNTKRPDGTFDTFTTTFDGNGYATVRAWGWHTTIIADLPATATYEVAPAQPLPNGYTYVNGTDCQSTIPADDYAVATLLYSYKPSAVTAQSALRKVLTGHVNGRKLEDGEFVFEYTVCLLQGNRCVTPPQGAANVTSGTVTNTAGGAIPISVVFNQGGMSSENWTRTYRVTVTERKGEELGINYNPSGKTVSIDFAITDNQKGALQYKVSQVESSSKEDTSQDQKITFSNYVYASNLPSTGLNTYAGLVIAVIVAGALFTAVSLWPNGRRHERE